MHRLTRLALRLVPRGHVVRLGVRSWLLVPLATLTLVQWPGPNELALPNENGALRFAVIGDAGTGGRWQQEVADRMLWFHDAFPFELVLMLGDNLYGAERPNDYVKKFERPYAGLLSRDVSFRAVLGNHDEPAQRFYDGFHMGGRRYYSFTPEGHDVRFFGLDSTSVDAAQIEWLATALAQATERWKICFFHHPIYSSGQRHGSDLELRAMLEPLFVRHGVNVVLAGHEHFYERLKPQRGIHYFTSGAAGKLRRGNVRRDSDLTAQRFDGDYSFMLFELDGSKLFYQTIARSGRTVDLGVVEHPIQDASSGSVQRGPIVGFSESHEMASLARTRRALAPGRP